MGRKSVFDNELVKSIQSEILDHKTAMVNLESQFRAAKSTAEKAHLARLASKIQQAVGAGISDYAIGRAAGKTAHPARKAFVEWGLAYDVTGRETE